MAPSSDSTGTAAGPQGRFNPWNWGRNVKFCGKWLQPGSKGLRARSEGLRRWEGKLWRSFQPRLCDGGWTDARKGRQAGKQADQKRGGVSCWGGRILLDLSCLDPTWCGAITAWGLALDTWIMVAGVLSYVSLSDMAVLMSTENAEFWGFRIRKLSESQRWPS